MKVSALSLFFAVLLVSLPLVSFAGPTTDTDGDGIFDVDDNCSATANASQNDSDGDLCGNVCDADINQNGSVDITDVSAHTSSFGAPIPPANPALNHAEPPGASVAITDISYATSNFGGVPGPSGTTPGNTACP